MFQVTDKVRKAFKEMGNEAKLRDGINSLVTDESAQGGIVGFYVYAAIAVVLGLQFAQPVIDSAVNGGGVKNVSGAASTLMSNFNLFLIIGLALILLKPVTG